MNIDEALEVIEQVLLARPLSSTERFVLQESWYGRTYEEMAQNCGYGSLYVKEIGAQLWHQLSEALGARVTKKNLHLMLSDYQQQQHSAQRQRLLISRSDAARAAEEPAAEEGFEGAIAELEFPGGPVSLDSPLYIERPPVEETAYASIGQPGCVLRIRAPRYMGKSSLLSRILARARTQAYEVVYIDLREADDGLFTSLDKFLRWFCTNVTRQLRLNLAIDEYWDEDMGSKVSCKIYFEAYLLEQLHTPLLLALNEVNRVFEYPGIAQDFLSMLRFWHEQAKQVEVWQALRLVLVHTTEVYVPLNLNQSPFNVGLAIRLPPFSIEQVQELAARYGLFEPDRGLHSATAPAANALSAVELEQLVELVGGHPYLANLAFYQLRQGKATLSSLLQTAPTQAGIYGTHLRRLLAMLREQPQLANALRSVVSSAGAVPLEAIAAYKLESMGLIQLNGNQAEPSCALYRLYFYEQLSVNSA